MKLLQVAFTVLVLFALSSAAPKGQQCLSCTNEECKKDNPRLRHCSQKCSTFIILGSGDKPNYNKPHITKGCSTDGYVKKFGCDNKCYDKKYTVGSTKYWVCVYCCTGDKCNKAGIPGIDAGLQLTGGFLTTLISAVFSLILAERLL